MAKTRLMKTIIWIFVAVVLVNIASANGYELNTETNNTIFSERSELISNYNKITNPTEEQMSAYRSNLKKYSDVFNGKYFNRFTDLYNQLTPKSTRLIAISTFEYPSSRIIDYANRIEKELASMEQLNEEFDNLIAAGITTDDIQGIQALSTFNYKNDLILNNKDIASKLGEEFRRPIVAEFNNIFGNQGPAKDSENYEYTLDKNQIKKLKYLATLPSNKNAEGKIIDNTPNDVRIKALRILLLSKNANGREVKDAISYVLAHTNYADLDEKNKNTITNLKTLIEKDVYLNIADREKLFTADTKEESFINAAQAIARRYENPENTISQEISTEYYTEKYFIASERINEVDYKVLVEKITGETYLIPETEKVKELGRYQLPTGKIGDSDVVSLNDFRNLIAEGFISAALLTGDQTYDKNYRFAVNKIGEIIKDKGDANEKNAEQVGWKVRFGAGAEDFSMLNKENKYGDRAQLDTDDRLKSYNELYFDSRGHVFDKRKKKISVVVGLMAVPGGEDSLITDLENADIARLKLRADLNSLRSEFNGYLTTFDSIPEIEQNNYQFKIRESSAAEKNEIIQRLSALTGDTEEELSGLSNMELGKRLFAFEKLLDSHRSAVSEGSMIIARENFDLGFSFHVYEDENKDLWWINPKTGLREKFDPEKEYGSNADIAFFRKLNEKLKIKQDEDIKKTISRIRGWQRFLGTLINGPTGYHKSFAEKINHASVFDWYNDIAKKATDNILFKPDDWESYICENFVTEGYPEDVKLETDKQGNKIIAIAVQGRKDKMPDNTTYYEFSWLLRPQNENFLYTICAGKCDSSCKLLKTADGSAYSDVAVPAGEVSSGSWAGYSNRSVSQVSLCYIKGGRRNLHAFIQPITHKQYNPDADRERYGNQDPEEETDDDPEADPNTPASSTPQGAEFL